MEGTWRMLRSEERVAHAFWVRGEAITELKVSVSVCVYVCVRVCVCVREREKREGVRRENQGCP